MEILQTIWTALTNENEILVKIISIPLAVIEIYLYMLLFLKLVKIDSTKKQRLIFLTSFSIVSILNIFFGIMPYNTFINAISMLLLIFIVFKVSLLKAILAEVIVYIIVLSFSAVLISAYSTIGGVPATITATVPIHKLCFSFLFYFCLYIFYTLCNKFKVYISILDKFKLTNFSLLILNFTIGSIAIGFEYYLLFNYIDFMPNHLVFFSLFVLLLYFTVSIFSLIITNKLEVTKQSLEEQKLYNKTLNTLHDNIRGFKHDFNNIVQAIGGYISTNNLDGLSIYYRDLLEECQLNNNLAVLNPELINNPAIYSLLADKHYKAEELGIKLNLEVLADLSNLNIKTYELTRILGILIDNAIEATSQCERKAVNITFRRNKKSDSDLIIIQNTYANKDINIDRIFEKGYTSKSTNLDDKNSKSHGLGLWEVRKYLKKNNNLDLYTTKNNEFFTQQFEIYN